MSGTACRNRGHALQLLYNKQLGKKKTFFKNYFKTFEE